MSGLDGWLVSYGVEFETNGADRKLDELARLAAKTDTAFISLTRAAKAAGGAIGDLGATATAAAAGVSKLSDALAAQAMRAGRSSDLNRATAAGFDGIAASANAAAPAVARANAMVAAGGGASLWRGPLRSGAGGLRSAAAAVGRRCQ